MIDLRTHLASLVAVFLALGIGILIGVDMIGGKTLVSQEKATARQLEADLTKYHHQNVQMAANLRMRNATIQILDQFGGQAVPVLVASRLAGIHVAVVMTSDQDPSILTQVIRDAGGTMGPVISLEPLTAKKMGQAASLLGVGPTAVGIDGAMAQDMATSLASGNPGQMPKLKAAGLFHVIGGFNQPVEAVLLVAGRTQERDTVAQTFGVPLVQDLKSHGVTLTEGEMVEIPPADSTIPLFDGLGIATVDDLDTAPGEVSMVWGLGGATGTWGEKSTAQALMPPLQTVP